MDQKPIPNPPRNVLRHLKEIASHLGNMPLPTLKKNWRRMFRDDPKWRHVVKDIGGVLQAEVADLDDFWKSPEAQRWHRRNNRLQKRYPTRVSRLIDAPLRREVFEHFRDRPEVLKAARKSWPELMTRLDDPSSDFLNWWLGVNPGLFDSLTQEMQQPLPAAEKIIADQETKIEELERLLHTVIDAAQAGKCVVYQRGDVAPGTGPR
jgi:hypothetical protein